MATSRCEDPSQKADAECAAIEIRPGVMLPDWSVISDPQAARALSALTEIIGVERKWSGLTEAEDRIWGAILQLYPKLGHAPSPAEIGLAAGMQQSDVEALVSRLRSRDIVVTGPAGRIIGAYPFTDMRADHRVEVDGQMVSSMCAIDALGMGAMLGTDIRIESQCHRCRCTIEIHTTGSGERIEQTKPSSSVAWVGLEHNGSCSATSLCTVLTFFCSEQHLNDWRGDQKSNADGTCLTIPQGLQVGRAIFEPFLKPLGRS